MSTFFGTKTFENPELKELFEQMLPEQNVSSSDSDMS
jgi:hypothetical protein